MGSDFEKGKARWLVLFNNSKNANDFSPKIGIESPTIGWRKSAAYDQLYYGQKCMCGVRGTKGPKQRPSLDPELAPQEDSPSRKIGRRIKQKRKKTGGSKSRKKKKATARKKGESRNNKGLVKRDTARPSTKKLRT